MTPWFLPVGCTIETLDEHKDANFVPFCPNYKDFILNPRKKLNVKNCGLLPDDDQAEILFGHKFSKSKLSPVASPPSEHEQFKNKLTSSFRISSIIRTQLLLDVDNFKKKKLLDVENTPDKLV
jgi:hypothetical protein